MTIMHMTGSIHRTGRDRLTAAFCALRSDDTLTQNEGVAAAIQIGAPAVPGLLALLDEPAINRAQIMYALAQIGDARSEAALLAALEDGDENVRAQGAQGLVRIAHPDALAACLRTLNDAADELHLDRTPSGAALAEMGFKVIPALLEMLLQPDELTRLRAQRALERLCLRRHEVRASLGRTATTAREAMRAEWIANGNYDYRSTARARAASVARWRRWLAENPEDA